ncbi:unnamed protein product [Phytomonas sp. Hart1]|nr:unnamed protein product [Phytomonas sp. Hart1]|eukprot:CCW70258.1 unnamed protein product [Phytomonas sp. isolate Hart1]
MRSDASKQMTSGSAFVQMMRQKRLNSGDNTNGPLLNGMQGTLLPPIASHDAPAYPAIKTPSTIASDAACRKLSVKTPPTELLRVIGELQRELNARTDSVNAIQRNFERLSGMYRQDQEELARITSELQGLRAASKDAAAREKVLLAVQLELGNFMQTHKELLVKAEDERRDHIVVLSAAEMQQIILKETCEGLSKDNMILSERIEELEWIYKQANADIADIRQRASLQILEDRKRQRNTVEMFVRRVMAAVEDCICSIKTSPVVGTSGMPSSAGGNAKETPCVVGQNEDPVGAVIDVETWEPWVEEAAQDLFSRLKIISPTLQNVLSAARKAMSELNFSFVVQSTIEPAEKSSRQRLEELEIYSRSVLQRSAQDLLDIVSCTLAKEKENSAAKEKIFQDECDRLQSFTHELTLGCEAALQHVCGMHLTLLDSYFDNKSQCLLDIAFDSQTYAQKQVQKVCEMSAKVHEVESCLIKATRDYEKRIMTIQAAHSSTLAQKKQEEDHIKIQHSREVQFLRDQLRESFQQKKQLLNETKGDFEQEVRDLKAQMDNLENANTHAQEEAHTKWQKMVEIIDTESAARMTIMTEENAHRLSEERTVGAALLELGVNKISCIHLSQQGAFDALKYTEEQQRCALYFEEYQPRLSVLQDSWQTQSQCLELAYKHDMEMAHREETAKLREVIQTRDQQHLCELDELLKQLDTAKMTETQLQAESATLQSSLKEEQAMSYKRSRVVFSAVGCLLSVEEASESAYSCLSCLKLLKTPQTCVPCGHTFCAACLFEHSRNKGESAQMWESAVGHAHHDTLLFCPECKMQNVRAIVSTRALEELATKFTYKMKVLRDVLAYLRPGAAEDEIFELPLSGDEVLLPS